jgi:hypothetical protein
VWFSESLTAVDSVHEYYGRHCPLLQVYLILSLLPSPDRSFITLLVDISGDSWNRIWDIFNRG